MAMRQIVIFPNKILRVKTKNIESLNKDILEEIKELEKILIASENGAGLAATQIGIDRRFFGIKDTETKKIKLFFNPKIEKSFGKKDFIKTFNNKVEEDFLEGCLSFPNFWGTVKRFSKIRVSWDDLIDGKFIRRDTDLDGFEAIVWQHESDHLDGIVFVDRVKNNGGKFFKTVDNQTIDWNVDEVLYREK